MHETSIPNLTCCADTTVLFRSDAFEVEAYRCEFDNVTPNERRASPADVVDLPSAGSYVRCLGRVSHVIDANHVAFFNRGDEYRTSHPYGAGDTGIAIAITRTVLHEMIAWSDPEWPYPADRPFRRSHALSSAETFLRRHLLIADLRRDDRPDALEIEERLFQMVRDVLVDSSAPPRRFRATRVHRDLARDVMGFLSHHTTEPVGLDEIATCLGVSKFHLCRVFKAVSGLTLHRYRDRLRLRAALTELERRDVHLGRLALDLGYSSQSHFTERFRREFGTTPAAVTRARGKRVRERPSSPVQSP